MTEFSVVVQTITSASAIVRLAGDMDANSFERLEEGFNNVLEAGVLGVVLDVSGLDSITSSGIGAVVNLSQILEDRKGKLVVAAPRPKIEGLLEMLGLTEALTIVDSLDKAKKLATAIRQT